MTAEVLGSGFKFVVESLMGGELLLPELAERVERLDPGGWYPWSDYVEATCQLAELLDEAAVVEVGQQIMLAARSHLESQGFTGPEPLLADWRRVFCANVRGLDDASVPYTREVGAGRAVIEYGTDLPPALVEGYLRGAVLAFDRRVESFDRQKVRVEGFERLRCTITWR